MATMDKIDAISFSAQDIFSSEEYFHRMLILERMKSQKTGKPFMLVLLNIDKLIKGKRTEKAFVLRRLVSVLNSSMRDIDFKGWYMFGSIIGIICQNVPEKHLDKVTGRLKHKLSEEGKFHLVGNNADAIKLLSLLCPN
jgi:hypothetical protein